ncbi:hypothetical protein JCM6882_009580 [Rhodosporidiobolus microsporus]
MSAPPAPLPHPFRLAPVPGKGNGLLATRDIQPGEVILVEKPLFQAGAIRSEASIAQLVKGLSAAEQEFFQSLSVGGRVGNPHLSRFDNNALPCGPGARTASILFFGSRFNHSCRPNVSQAWDEANGVERFIANEHIHPGVELTTYYVEILQSKAERQALLRREIGFDCHCVVCSLPADALKISDTRRTTFQLLRDQIPSLITSPHQLIKLAKQALKCLDDEGLVAYRASIAYDAFQGCIAWGDVENAKKWAQRGLEYNRIEVGEDGTEYKRIKALLEQPKSHYAFGALGRKTVEGP